MFPDLLFFPVLDHYLIFTSFPCDQHKSLSIQQIFLNGCLNLKQLMQFSDSWCQKSYSSGCYIYAHPVGYLANWQKQRLHYLKCKIAVPKIQDPIILIYLLKQRASETQCKQASFFYLASIFYGRTDELSHTLLLSPVCDNCPHCLFIFFQTQLAANHRI